MIDLFISYLFEEAFPVSIIIFNRYLLLSTVPSSHSVNMCVWFTPVVA